MAFRLLQCSQNTPEHVQIRIIKVCISARHALPLLRFYFLYRLCTAVWTFVSSHCTQDIQRIEGFDFLNDIGTL